MALVWRKTIRSGVGEHNYEVRSAGQSVRLYTDGIFHSQWNPARPFSGHLWDLLFLPALLHSKPESIASALVLGVGGGSLINLYQHFLRLKSIDGVDLDKTHLMLARRFFLSTARNTCFIHQDARDFVRQSRKKYDIVVDDLFCAKESEQHQSATRVLRSSAEAVRPIPADKKWLSALKKQMTANGVLVINFESREQLRSALKKPLITSLGFASVFAFSNRRYENAIAALQVRPVAKPQFSKALDIFLKDQPKKEVKDLEFSVERIF